MSYRLWQVGEQLLGITPVWVLHINISHKGMILVRMQMDMGAD